MAKITIYNPAVQRVSYTSQVNIAYMYMKSMDNDIKKYIAYAFEQLFCLQHNSIAYNRFLFCAGTLCSNSKFLRYYDKTYNGVTISADQTSSSMFQIRRRIYV